MQLASQGPCGAILSGLVPGQQVELSPGHEGAAPAPGSPSSSSSSQELLPWQLQGPPALCQQHDATRTLSHGASFSPHPGLVQTPSLSLPDHPASGQGSSTSLQPGLWALPRLC